MFEFLIKSYTLELMNSTADSKDGEGLCVIFEEMIDRVEKQHECVVTSFTTDADGGSKKGRVILIIRRPWLFGPSCWGHQVR